MGEIGEKRSFRGLQREIVLSLVSLAILSIVIVGALAFKIAPELRGAKAALFLLVFAGTYAGVLAWAGYRVIRFLVVSPLQRIERAARDIAAGDHGRQVPSHRMNEIGRLGSAIEEMRRHLLEGHARLSDSIASLQRMNREVKEAQRAVVRGEKLASVGSLAAGVAHEVGNPLGAVLGYLALLRTLPEGNERQDILTRCDTELSRISRLLRQLLDYSRPMRIPEEPVDVADVVRSTVAAAVAVGLPPGVQVDLDLRGPLPPLSIDPDPLRQVVWNLVQNAIDAVGQAGEVRVTVETLEGERLREEPLGLLFQSRTRRGDAPTPEVLARRSRGRMEDGANSSAPHRRSGEPPAFLFAPEGEVVRILVQDTGPGIAAGEIGKIFDPFYTTKPPGKGTGLGLFVSLNLTEMLGGFLDVRSEPSEGATFLLLLPVRPGTQTLQT